MKDEVTLIRPRGKDITLVIENGWDLEVQGLDTTDWMSFFKEQGYAVNTFYSIERAIKYQKRKYGAGSNGARALVQYSISNSSRNKP